GFPVVLMSPLAFLSRPSAWLRAIHRHRGTISGGPNFAYELCLRRIPEQDLAGLDLSSWRFAFNGAEPVSPETLAAFEEKFSKYQFRKHVLSPVYGLAEASVGLAFTPPGEPWTFELLDRERLASDGEAVRASDADPAPVKIVACGSALPDHDLRIVDAAGLELPDRHEGHLQFRGPSATSGYYRNPEATRALFDGAWVNTGDRAYLSAGALYITGREKDVIIRGGRNISPYELEEAVGDLEGVRRGCVAVFGSLDRASGTERVVVLAETRAEDAALHQALRRRINDLALGLLGGPVDDIVLAPPHTVPKTSSGKIRRVAARDYYERGASAVRPQAVWLQFLRLAAAGALPQLRRGWRVVRGLAFAARGYLAFPPLMLAAFLGAATGNPRIAWTVSHYSARAFLRLLGVPVVVRGLERLPTAGPVVIAPNHTSYVDGLVLMAVLPYRGYAFVAKSEFLGNFVMRTFLGGLGSVFVERFDVQKSAEHADELVAAARRGVSLILFPEGTFRHRAGLLPFRTGAFQVAAQAGIPTMPIGLRGTRSLLREGTWYFRRSAVTVTFGEPVMPDGSDWAAAVRLRDRVRAEILKSCGEPDVA
ncbi:MAG TPA: 1-acyl-sn-glycerol-3-phosphate acyltransferase, partial [Thermoanaerobaculia bacterium]|nr:1-acyl-sn-glycerol-3-phosphate acyltransferase [Thermoanaerobaculia bacterium]